MSNEYAIATVTATLQQLLDKAVAADFAGAHASMLTPDGPAAGLADPGVNIFLYQVSPNAAWRNRDLPTRGSDGRPMSTPRAAVDLHYLLTFYGQDDQFEPQRVLGSVVRTLHAKPILTRPQIEDSLSAFPVLTPSDLADEVEVVKFTQLPLTLEELSKLWSVFFQTTYHLSVAYSGTVVLLDAHQAFASALPVRQRNVYVEVLREPLIEAVVAASADDAPILDGAQIRIRGERLMGEAVDVLIDGVSAPAVTIVSEFELTAQLPPLPAGVHGVQVIHERVMGTPPTAHPGGVASNVFPFVLTPKIRKNGAYDIAVASPTSRVVGGIAYHSADLQIVIDPVVGKRQRAAFILNELTAVDAHAYTFVSGKRAADSNTITIPVLDVIPGQYLVRVQVDGAESPLDLAAGSYSDPRVTL